MTEQAEGMNLDDDPMDIFKIGYDYLKTRVGYLFLGKRMKLEIWVTPYWSIKVQRSYIMKHGAEGDKEKIPEATKRNQSQTHQTRETEDGQ